MSEIRDLAKPYGTKKAIDQLSVTIRPGTVAGFRPHCLRPDISRTADARQPVAATDSGPGQRLGER